MNNIITQVENNKTSERKLEKNISKLKLGKLHKKRDIINQSAKSRKKDLPAISVAYKNINSCKFIKSDGNQCQARAMKGSNYCFTHNPDTKLEKYLAVVKGGLNSKKFRLNLLPISIKTPQEVNILLEDTINRVRRGEIPSTIANSIGYLAGHALKAIEASEAKKDKREETTDKNETIMFLDSLMAKLSPEAMIEIRKAISSLEEEELEKE